MGSLFDREGRPFRVRAARPDDSPSLGALLAELVRDDLYILLSPEEVSTDDLRRVEEIARAESVPDRWFLGVVEVDERVVGMVDIRAAPMRRCAHVCELGIGLGGIARDRGIGTGVMQRAIEIARGMGFEKMRLFVIDGNDRARHVYDRTGFRETGRFVREVRVGDGTADLVVMERDLR